MFVNILKNKVMNSQLFKIIKQMTSHCEMSHYIDDWTEKYSLKSGGGFLPRHKLESVQTALRSIFSLFEVLSNLQKILFSKKRFQNQQKY